MEFEIAIYLYGCEYDPVTAMDERSIFHKMDICNLGYGFECASNRLASRRRFSRNEDIFELSCPQGTCKEQKHFNLLG